MNNIFHHFQRVLNCQKLSQTRGWTFKVKNYAQLLLPQFCFTGFGLHFQGKFCYVCHMGYNKKNKFVTITNSKPWITT